MIETPHQPTRPGALAEALCNRGHLNPEQELMRIAGERQLSTSLRAAILAMIPLSRSDFFGPQAITILGGLLVATVLTVFFVPALYAMWFRVQRTALRTQEAP